MAEDAVAQTETTATGQEPAQAEGTPQTPETVSLKDFLAHKEASKRRETKFKAENEAQAQRLRELEHELEVLKTNPSADATDEEIKAVKLSLLKKHRELEARQGVLTKREKDIAEKERQGAIKELAKQYGVSAEALADSDDPEKEALKLYVEKIEKAAKPGTNGKPTPKLERGSPNRGGATVLEMAPDEFQKHLDRLKREAASKR